MKKFGLLLLTMLIATACLAKTRNWKPAAVIGISETALSGPLVRASNILHYTIETDDMVFFLDYSYHPDQHSKNSPPGVAVNSVTKIAVEGKHAYILDNSGSEVKMHIVKKMKK